MWATSVSCDDFGKVVHARDPLTEECNLVPVKEW